MCGIVGALVFDKASFRITEPYISRMRDVMTHRGPDGAGVWIATDGRVGLGHRRLSIIDLSDAATQPMCNEDGTVWVSFNGEIYNHAEIRTELESIGGIDGRPITRILRLFFMHSRSGESSVFRSSAACLLLPYGMPEPDNFGSSGTESASSHSITASTMEGSPSHQKLRRSFKIQISHGLSMKRRFSITYLF